MVYKTEKMDKVEVRAVIKYFYKKDMCPKEIHDVSQNCLMSRKW